MLAFIKEVEFFFFDAKVFCQGGCRFWPTNGRIKGRFTGPWNAKLETPMLVVSNVADPCVLLVLIHDA